MTEALETLYCWPWLHSAHPTISQCTCTTITPTGAPTFACCVVSLVKAVPRMRHRLIEVIALKRRSATTEVRRQHVVAAPAAPRCMQFAGSYKLIKDHRSRRPAKSAATHSEFLKLRSSCGRIDRTLNSWTNPTVAWSFSATDQHDALTRFTFNPRL